MSKHFICPKCGSFMFGSTQNKDGTLTRFCRGNESWSCGLTFHQSDDDKYFHDECKHCKGRGYECKHTIGTAVDDDGCCVSCGEDLNYIVASEEPSP